MSTLMITKLEHCINVKMLFNHKNTYFFIHLNFFGNKITEIMIVISNYPILCVYDISFIRIIRETE